MAIPRIPFLNYCEPRKDFKGINKVFSSLKYKFSELQKERYDLVYSAGLYDYIKTFPDNYEKGTIALTKNLFDLVKPGGLLILGNFSPNNPGHLRFPMEFVYDWQLIYRDEKDLLMFISSIDKNEICDLQVEKEPLGINYFLKVKKKM